jgi:hypothetical protein
LGSIVKSRGGWAGRTARLGRLVDTENGHVVIPTILFCDVVLGQLDPKVPSRSLPVRRIIGLENDVWFHSVKQSAEVGRRIVRMQECEVMDRSYEDDLRPVGRMLLAGKLKGRDRDTEAQHR